MAKPCAVFWDIQNSNVPKGKSFDSIVHSIRSDIIRPYNLNEIFFFCVCDVKSLPFDVNQSTAIDVEIVQAYSDSADIKIIDLMRRFARFAGQDCAVILISCDTDYYNTLCYLKKFHNVKIHIVDLGNRFLGKLGEISDYKFVFDNYTFKRMEPVAPMYFISIKNYPLRMKINIILNDLYRQITESIRDSAILIDDSICIGFPTLWHAENANGWRFHGTFLKTELIVDSPLAEILKCIKPVQSESYSGLKQLTFIKMNNSNAADDRKIIKFCIDCSTKSSSQCILSRKPFLWIVSAFKSDAQDCLSKVQIMYPDAVISDPPVDLTSKFNENPYTVESCEQEVSIAATSPVDNQDANGWNIFFRRTSSLTGPYASTKWLILYDLFELLYDYGAKKVIFDRNVYCAHFDSVSLYQEVLRKIDSLHFSELKFVNEKGLNKQLSKKLNRYKFSIPWCLTAELDIYCLVVKIDAQIQIKFMERCKKCLGDICIFIKLVLNEFWIGFPNKLPCDESEERIRRILYNINNVSTTKSRQKRQNLNCSSAQISTAKPSSELLESINLYDLIGKAYGMAFRLSELQCFEPITKPRIMKRMSLLRTKEQECNAAFYYITVYANFRDWLSWAKLTSEQIVKILVHLSKVIPLAATATDHAVDLVFNSWYEAISARNAINNLKPAKVPYFTEFERVDNFKQRFLDISEYYVINRKGKVGHKIILENKNQEDEIDSNSSKVQSKVDVDVSDEEMIKKLEYCHRITTDSDFKLTPGIVSIVEMYLIQNDCLAYMEFEDAIWVGFADSRKAFKALEQINDLKFKLLHENDKHDFDVGVVMEPWRFPPKVAELLANELRNPKKSCSNIYNIYSSQSAAPLNSFFYGFRKHLERQSTNLVSLKHQLDP